MSSRATAARPPPSEAILETLTGADGEARRGIDIIGGQHAHAIEGAEGPGLDTPSIETPSIDPDTGSGEIEAASILGGAALAAALFGEPDEEIDLTDLQAF